MFDFCADSLYRRSVAFVLTETLLTPVRQRVRHRVALVVVTRVRRPEIPLRPVQQVRCLEAAYRKTPYFEYYFPYLEKVFSTRFEKLVDLNEFCLKFILKTLKINKEIVYTEDFEPISDANDYRVSLSKWSPGMTDFPKYYQVFEDRQPFISNLSVIDLIFNEGPEASDYLKLL